MHGGATEPYIYIYISWLVNLGWTKYDESVPEMWAKLPWLTCCVGLPCLQVAAQRWRISPSVEAELKVLFCPKNLVRNQGT